MKTIVFVLLTIFVFSCNQPEIERKTVSENHKHTTRNKTENKTKDERVIPDVLINSIEDIHQLKNRGIGISTFSATNQRYEVNNEMKNFGSYNLFDTTQLDIEYLGILEIMTNTEIQKHRYDSKDEKVIAFITDNSKFVFSKDLRIGEPFDDLNIKVSQILNDSTIQFKLEEMDFILTLSSNKNISKITVGNFVTKTPA